MSASTPEEGGELDELLARHGITYLAVDPAETTTVLKDYRLVKEGNPVVVLSTSYRPTSAPPAPPYWDGWRIAGVITTFALVAVVIAFKRWSDYEERLELEEIQRYHSAP